MSERKAQVQHAKHVERVIDRTDAIMAKMSDTITGAISALGDRALMASDMNRIMRKVDRALADVYGPAQTDDCALGNTIADEATRTRKEVISGVIRPIEQALKEDDPATLGRIERAVRRD